jgi:hypothetical protein
VREPFTISQTAGDLKGHSSTEVLFSFSPRAALVYDAVVVLKYGELGFPDTNLFKTMHVHGTGKYPHILVESSSGQNGGLTAECTLNFDKVLIGHSVTRYVTVVNMTEVKSDFFVERDSQVPVFDVSFNCLQHMGTLQPFERQKIAVIIKQSIILIKLN